MTNLQERGHLLTEQINPHSLNLDQLNALELVELFNSEDQKALSAIAGAKMELAAAIEQIAAKLHQGGRLFYIGAGTSGRLGVLDAAECPPTFCTPPDLVQGIMLVVRVLCYAVLRVWKIWQRMGKMLSSNTR